MPVDKRWQWTLWARHLDRLPLRWNLEVTHRVERLEEFAEVLRQEDQRYETLILPPGECPGG